MRSQVIVAFFILRITTIWAQSNEVKFTLIEGPDGKPLGKIRNITQDPHGYMWFAGEGASCIYRYDGTRIIAFRNDPANPNSLGGQFIRSIYADDAGIIWIGINEGLDRFDPTTGVFRHYRNDPNDPASLSASPTPMLKDRQGRLWVGTDKGLDLLDEKTGKFTHHRHDPANPTSLSNDVVWNLYEDRQGVLWIATGFPFYSKNADEGGLNRLEHGGTFTRYKHDPRDPHTLINNKVRAMFEDSRGIFWVGTSGDGLHTLDRNTGRFERHTYDPNRPDKLSRPPLKKDDEFAFNNDQVAFIHQDVVGSIWIGTMWSGINRYDTATKKITHYEVSNGFPDKSGWNIYQSRDGVLWITTQEDNLYRVDPFVKKINHRVTTPTMPVCFADDDEGNLWVGTDGGLLRYDHQRILLSQFNHNPLDSQSLFDKENDVLSLSNTKGDTLWIGTSDGPGFFNKRTKQFSRLPITIKYNQTPYRNVPNLTKDRQGLLWFVLNGSGLLRYNPGDQSFRQYLHNDKDTSSLTSDHIVDVYEDKSGVIWASDYSGGVNRLDRKSDTFKHYLRGNQCFGMYEHSAGALLMGTNAGLYTYNRGQDKFEAFFDPESEVSKMDIIQIAEDKAQNLWLYSTKALIELNPTNREVFIYSTKFGIPPDSGHPLAFYKDRKGQFHMGNGNGFYSFYPEELSQKVPPLNILTTEFYLNSVPVLPGKGSELKGAIEEISDLNLSYNQNNIAFSFAAIDYRSPEGIRYFTMLEGYDNIWRQVRGEKSSYYFNIAPGRYSYRIKAINADGTTGEKIILIHIAPPWWQTWWAYTTYGLFFIGALWASYRYQRKQVIRSEREKTREKELAQAKEIGKAYTDLKATQALLIQSEKMASLGELTAGIAHEIQNPLNFVKNFSEVNSELIDDLEKEINSGNFEEVKALAKDIKENEQKIVHHGNRADAIVKGMLQHSRSSSGIKEPTDINALADEYLRLAYHGLRAKDKSFNANMHTDFDSSIGTISIIPQDIGRVILNLITNAFYAVSERKQQQPEGPTTYEPTVTVGSEKRGDKVLIFVKDNGNGIPQRVLDKIFQPFFTTKPTGRGTGLGLSLSYDIIKAHGGELTVETTEGKGSEFVIKLPSV